MAGGLYTALFYCASVLQTVVFEVYVFALIMIR